MSVGGRSPGIRMSGVGEEGGRTGKKCRDGSQGKDGRAKSRVPSCLR